jgi:hypothetical protein
MAEVQIQMPQPADSNQKPKKEKKCSKLFKKDKTPTVPFSRILDVAADYRPMMAFGSICKCQTLKRHVLLIYTYIHS